MVNYSLSIDHPNQQYIGIKVNFKANSETLIVRIPAWRPGRYELGNFAKNIKGFKAFSDKNERLTPIKLDKNTWSIDTKGSAMVKVEYYYYAAELNAGSTFLSADQLYVNPVNCLVYTDEQKEDDFELLLKIPEHWTVASSLRFKDSTLSGKSFDELADSPFVCSKHLQSASYTSNETIFHIWFNGPVKPDWERLLKDFSAFTDKQIEKFSEFPVKEYHFIFQILPYKAYHGVEHSRSTVITLGPSYEVFDSLYKELLGVSSHELYHTWNVKAIRPIEMFPYDFSKENYSRLGFICEGITTYLGDLFLLKSKVFNLEQYFDEMNKQLQKHFDNHGRFNYSVSDSSFDTWLDGYVPGAPARKVSIYTEGCLLAFVMDVKLLESTKNKYGLDEVMKRLYFNFALKGKGVSEDDFRQELMNISGQDFSWLFEKFIHGTNPYEEILTEAFEYLGLVLHHEASKSYSSARIGIKVVPNNSNFTISAIFPGSPADISGLSIGDEIIAVNDVMCSGELDKWLNYFDDDEKSLHVTRAGRLLSFRLPEVNRTFYNEYKIKKIADPNGPQKKGFEAWSN